MNERWVFFCDNNSVKNSFLKKNYRHSFIITRDQFNWILIDPENKQLTVKILPYSTSFDLPKKILGECLDYSCIKLEIKDKKKKHICLPWRFFTCVGIVKYSLGLSIHALTPYRLYKKLKKLENKKICGLHKLILSSKEVYR